MHIEQGPILMAIRGLRFHRAIGWVLLFLLAVMAISCLWWVNSRPPTLSAPYPYPQLFSTVGQIGQAALAAVILLLLALNANNAHVKYLKETVKGLVEMPHFPNKNAASAAFMLSDGAVLVAPVADRYRPRLKDLNYLFPGGYGNGQVNQYGMTLNWFKPGRAHPIKGFLDQEANYQRDYLRVSVVLTMPTEVNESAFPLLINYLVRLGVTSVGGALRKLLNNHIEAVWGGAKGNLEYNRLELQQSADICINQLEALLEVGVFQGVKVVLDFQATSKDQTTKTSFTITSSKFRPAKSFDSDLQKALARTQQPSS